MEALVDGLPVEGPADLAAGLVERLEFSRARAQRLFGPSALRDIPREAGEPHDVAFGIEYGEDAVVPDHALVFVFPRGLLAGLDDLLEEGFSRCGQGRRQEVEHVRANGVGSQATLTHSLRVGGQNGPLQIGQHDGIVGRVEEHAERLLALAQRPVGFEEVAHIAHGFDHVGDLAGLVFQRREEDVDVDASPVGYRVDVVAVARLPGLEDVAQPALLPVLVARRIESMRQLVAEAADDFVAGEAHRSQVLIVDVGDAVVAVDDDDVLVEGVEERAVVALSGGIGPGL